jgi:hypothetical protein
MSYSQEKDAEEYNRQGEPEPPKDRWASFIVLCMLLILLATALFSCGG